MARCRLEWTQALFERYIKVGRGAVAVGKTTCRGSPSLT